MISRGRARETYGVPGDRAELRRARLDGARAPAVSSPASPGEPLAQIGPSLKLTRGVDGPQIECVCGHVLASGGGNWKEGAATKVLQETELSPGIIVHPSLVLVRYLCPACGRQHSVEVTERGAPPLNDLSVDG
ncbi:MAG: acetone carboxylase subunit gamma [Solirubrobacteraceae bacterium]